MTETPINRRQFTAGAVGYQITEEPSIIGNTYYSFSLLGSLANLLLWMAIFKLCVAEVRETCVSDAWSFLTGAVFQW